jgi:hypothetical protein
MRDNVMKLWADARIDPMEAIQTMMKEREVIARALKDRGGRMGPISGFVVPTLRTIGLYSERIAAHFKEMWAANMGAEAAERMANSGAQVPDDLEAWVNEGYETL